MCTENWPVARTENAPPSPTNGCRIDILFRGDTTHDCIISKLDLCEGGIVWKPIFKSDIKIDVYHISCFISVCPFIALSARWIVGMRLGIMYLFCLGSVCLNCTDPMHISSQIFEKQHGTPRGSVCGSINDALIGYSVPVTHRWLQVNSPLDSTEVRRCRDSYNNPMSLQ